MKTLNIQQYLNEIFEIRDQADFDRLSLEAFHHQYSYNLVYHQFVSNLNIDPSSVSRADQIPFLPIEFFKTQTVITGTDPGNLVFRSSGTTGFNPSQHFITDPSAYVRSFTEAFRLFFGDPSELCFLALLPSYLERDDSSLVYMVDHLIGKSKYKESGFYLNANESLITTIRDLESRNIPVILFGVTFALLDLAEEFPVPLKSVRIIETGGMKGRRQEITREELHVILKDAFHCDRIFSEYGMTELLSQAYLTSDSGFESPPWMQVYLRETTDPLAWVKEGKTGGISVIDLANIHSCCFIATQDLGKRKNPNTFSVLGRYDNSDIRGCNLMVG